ncbi:hypothetical protein ACS2QU_27685 [Bacillus cereus group sp. Bce005]|uniref:hypothetical protein n=1 Tax=Bacillus cereus group sp. Bce005 TaxID=3445256 RepID=UPI003F25CD82
MNLDINQTGPTCGIYGLANGLLNMNKVSSHKKEKIDQEIYELLKEFKFRIKDNEFTGYTLVGEFFKFNTFKRFIENVIHELHKNIISGEINPVDDNFKYVIEIANVSDLTQYSLIQQLNNNEAFILFSILKQYNILGLVDDIKALLGFNRIQKHVISHWICIHGYCNNVGKFIVTDSYKGERVNFTYEKLKKKNARLENKIFKWEKYTGQQYFQKKNTVTSTSKQIIDLVTEQLKNKEEYLKKNTFKSVIEHTAGKMIVIRKVKQENSHVSVK